METTERNELMLLLEQAENLYFQYRITEAKVIFQKLLDENVGRAAYYLYDISTLSSQEDVSDKLSAKETLIKGIELNDSFSIMKYLNSLDEFEDNLVDETVSKKVYAEVFTTENPAMQYEVSTFYYSTLKKKDDGFYWLTKSADAGYWKAKNMLAIKYFDGKDGVKKDHEKAREMWLELAKINYEPAIYNGFVNAKTFNTNNVIKLYFGYFLNPEKIRAVNPLKDQFETIANQGFSHAVNYRGYCMWNGYDDYEKNKEDAITNLKKAADAGNSYAIKNLTTYKKKNDFALVDWELARVLYY